MNFLTDAVDYLTTYKTPEKVIDYVNTNLMLQNAPYDMVLLEKWISHREPEQRRLTDKRNSRRNDIRS